MSKRPTLHAAAAAAAAAVAVAVVVLGAAGCPQPLDSVDAPGPDGGPSLRERVSTLEQEVTTLRAAVADAKRAGANAPPEVVPVDLAHFMLNIVLASADGAAGAGGGAVAAKVQTGAPSGVDVAGIRSSVMEPELLVELREKPNEQGLVMTRGKKTVYVVGQGECTKNAAANALIEGTKMGSYACHMSGKILRPDKSIVAPLAWSRNVLGISAQNALKSLESNRRGAEALAATLATELR